jgi:predicted RNA methylase
MSSTTAYIPAEYNLCNDIVWQMRKNIYTISELVGDLRGKTVLDAGCGTGVCLMN